MKVLVACEFSGVVRDGFAARGHDAVSCDLLPTERPGQHYQGDVRDILGDGWDLMIAHPECRYLSYAGVGSWNKPGRAELREEAMAFFMEMVNAPIPRICVENPRGYPFRAYRQPDQTIHPYFFGDRQLKRTCLWLKGLPKLYWLTQDDLFGNKQMLVDPPPPLGFYGADSKQPGKKRWFVDSGTKDPHERSRTFPAIAEAMAAQWGTDAALMSDMPLFAQAAR